MAGKFIVFEGITGSGKKTHIHALAERLRQQGREVITIGFPNYETEIARLTKKPDMDPVTASLLHAADRSFNQERIKALLERGSVVLCDRYSYSNFAYQSARGVSMDWLQCIEQNLVKPDMVILIDVPTNISMDRVLQSNIEDFTKKEILTRLDKERAQMENIRQAYLQLARKDKDTKWFVIDGSQEMARNQEQVWAIVKQELGI